VENSRNSYYVTKRILDIVVAFTMLVLLFPLMFIIAIVIFLYSPGPVFFTQKRVGVKRIYYKKRSYSEP
jgi:lipopolysaccharide/colanic/teichoic acid biosynthesis glycosyltransferase